MSGILDEGCGAKGRERGSDVKKRNHPVRAIPLAGYKYAITGEKRPDQIPGMVTRTKLVLGAASKSSWKAQVGQKLARLPQPVMPGRPWLEA